MTPSPKAVVFDVYNTLFHNDVDNWVKVFEGISSDQSLPIDGPSLWKRWKVLEVEFRKNRNNMEDLENSPPFQSYEEAWRGCFQKVFGELGAGDAEEAARVSVQSMTQTEPFPETMEALGQLKAITRVAILSNADDDYLLPTLGRYDLEFEAVLSSESVRAYKPHPKPFRDVLSRMGLSPQEAIYVGDNPFDDILGAYSVGMGTVWVNRNGQEYDRSNPEPDHVISDLRELLELVNGSK